MARDKNPEINPVDSSVSSLAQDIHDNLLSELGMSGTSDEALNKNQENYPFILFGNLAMHIAGIKLNPNHSNADRARGITDALQKITQSPDLLERITDSPINQNDLNTPVQVSQFEEANPRAISLQEKVAQKGYLEHSMVPLGSMVQLVYTTIKPIRNGVTKKNSIPKDTEISLKLVANKPAFWNVKRYNNWDSTNGYYNPRDTKKYEVHSIFNITAISSSIELPKKLANSIGELARIGQVSLGSFLTFDYNFTRNEREVPGYEPKIQFCNHLIREAVLTQAYFGESKNYPLFNN